MFDTLSERLQATLGDVRSRGKLTEDGTNANHTTSQALTDLGAGATFYDNMVEVTGM